MALKDNLRKIRLSRFLSQSELAARAGVSKGTIIRLEAGAATPHPRTIRLLAECLNVDPGEIATPDELVRTRGKEKAA